MYGSVWKARARTVTQAVGLGVGEGRVLPIIGLEHHQRRPKEAPAHEESPHPAAPTLSPARGEAPLLPPLREPLPPGLGQHREAHPPPAHQGGAGAALPLPGLLPLLPPRPRGGGQARPEPDEFLKVRNGSQVEARMAPGPPLPLDGRLS